ncbi:hypothetical protein [Leifsonia sp. 71-9]|uniref:hypothetical protein n=1 Tax=Leifsonia sp. 71-9 TaxID=1895934 RepID=UPI000925A919|nr:hypothetical protein [Leifsonia sp. 71-9]OJX73170.1 MAG: hypothetical protein BGO91_15720 [Leifsonia sp. 71-9]
MSLKLRSYASVVSEAAVIALSLGGIAPASASPESETEPALSALEGMGLLDHNDVESATGSLDLIKGLIVDTADAAVSLRPVAQVSPTVSDDGKALIYVEDPAYSLAVTGASSQADAGYVVIHDAGAPTRYEFAIEVDGEPAALVVHGDRVLVQDVSGATVNVIASPWARDANGVAIPTRYHVDGNVLMQFVDHSARAAYPVVADPRMECNWLNCTLELTRGETRALANNTLNAGIVCALTGSLAAACAAVLIASWAMANVAVNTGQCIGVRIINLPIPNNPHAVYVPCYA